MTPEVAGTEITARAAGIAVCRDCGRLAPAPHGTAARCSRCGAALEVRPSGDQARCAAYLLAAAILYVPANVLTVLRTTSLFDTQDDTILSGVLYLANIGSWPLAALVFFASVMVPVMKLIGLGSLLWSVRRGSASFPLPRARLLRLVHFVGRWSMLDVFVAALLLALVRFHGLASIEIGPGMLAFAGVVVLTMLAAQSFDARRIWDQVETP
jgi:paraquat-inducible protein A